MEPVLESGILRLKSEGKGGDREREEYVIRELDATYMPQVMALQSVIVQHLADRDFLEPFAVDFMRKHFRKRGFVLGTFWGDVLVAFRNVYFPDKHDGQWNLGRDVGLADSELETVANLQMVCVHPDFRGHALARKMNLAALRLLRKIGTYKHICATVHPSNFWNVRILFDCGFSLRRIKLKYGGKIRYIAYQHLTDPVTFDHQQAVDVPLADLETHQVLMHQGYQGVRIKKKVPVESDPLSAWHITFKQPVQEPCDPEQMVYVVQERRQNSHRKKHRHPPVVDIGDPKWHPEKLSRKQKKGL
jgi:ribosomal protein S18 acetylase RimI-like enzyme